MNVHYILTDYIDRAIGEAEYDKLADNSFAGRIDSCKGVVAFAPSLKECEGELRSTLEEWILLGLKLGHSLPVVDGIDLNKEPEYEPMEAV
jgi:predicted RNase H-like HicB family nuclease